MFGLFRKKTEQEIEFEGVMKALKQSAKDIKKHKGMFAEVCLDFVKFAKDDELFNAVGLIWDKYVPHKKVHVAHASIMLLAALKTGLIQEDKDDFLYTLAKYSYENCVFIMSNEEIQPLLTDLDILKQKKAELKELSTKLWIDWEQMDLDILRKVAQL